MTLVADTWLTQYTLLPYRYVSPGISTSMNMPEPLRTTLTNRTAPRLLPYVLVKLPSAIAYSALSPMVTEPGLRDMSKIKC